MKNIVKALQELEDLRAQKKLLDEKIKKVQVKVLKEMESTEQYVFEEPVEDNLVLRASYVQAETVVYFAERFRTELDSKTFRKITRPVVAKDKLEAALQAGDITVDVIDRCSEIKQSAPYVRIDLVAAAQ